MQRLDHIDALRGIASLAVCWYHMARGGELFETSWLASLSSFGFLGVEVFFVISGFVLPWSLAKSEYAFGKFGRFWKRRLVRLHPPFLIACLLALILNVVSILRPGYDGPLSLTGYPSMALWGLVTDGFYVTGLMGREWILVVAWTLALEIQFYLLLSLLFPVLRHPRMELCAILLLACSGILMPSKLLVFHWMPLFALGWSASLIRRGHASSLFWVPVLVSLGCIWSLVGVPELIAALFAFGWLFWDRLKVPKWLSWSGAISYALYLVHVPIGGRVINLFLGKMQGDGGVFGLCVLASIISIVAAWAFWKWIEHPFHHLSRKVRS